MAGKDNKRFSTLVEPHLDALFRAAYRLTRNQTDAQDLVQDTCLRAYGRLEGLKEPHSAKAWLLRVMHNLFVDGIRRERFSPIDSVESFTDVATTSVCPLPTPEQALANRQQMAQLERAWRRLDRGYRALLALRADGYTPAEISTITSIPTDALNMRLYRARQQLARCLHEERMPSTVSPKEAVK
jgi:RNA polymerase sigma factor (sigma-70 family)